MAKTIKPGATISGALVYDTPPGTEFRHLAVCHDPLSAGTTIDLT